MIKEFKEFAMRGNVLDMAIGIIMGSAFGKIITSLIENILMPLISGLFNTGNIASLAVRFGTGANGKAIIIKYGLFIQNVVDFIIIAFCIFIMVKSINKAKDRMAKKNEQTEEKIVKNDEVVLLEEIRDLLKKQKVD